MQFGILTFDEPKRDTSRKILHIDMDAFYASVEIQANPDLKGKPVIIAKHPKDTDGRGVVTTASYEARKFGVHSAMSSMKAYELCPQGIFVPPNFDLYRKVSHQIHDIFKEYTDVFQPISLDEAYLDVTENKKNIPSGTIIARSIQKDIYQKTGLTCSAGVSYNKFIAKLASDYKKPGGLTVVDPDSAHGFLMNMLIENFHGVGKKTVVRMHDLDIYTGADLYHWSEYDLIKEFGKMGSSLFRKVRGIDNSPVQVDTVRKSIGKERTFQQDLYDPDQIIGIIRKLSNMTFQESKEKGMHGKTAVLKIRYVDFQTITKRVSFPNYIQSSTELFNIMSNIWEEVGQASKGVRLLGVTLTKLDPILYENLLLPLFDDRQGDSQSGNET